MKLPAWMEEHPEYFIDQDKEEKQINEMEDFYGEYDEYRDWEAS